MDFCAPLHWETMATVQHYLISSLKIYAAVFLHARDKLKMSATKHNKDVMHVRFILKAFSHDKLLLIYDCIDFILFT